MVTHRSTRIERGRERSGPSEAEGAAGHLRALAELLLGSPLPIQIECWDGSTVGPEPAPACLRIKSPDALRRIVRAPGELGVARAFVAGEIDSDDDLVEALRILSRVTPSRHSKRTATTAAVLAARRLHVLGAPPPPPEIEHRPRRSKAHTVDRDAEAVGHHYDVSNAFYSMVLGRSMTYSCARFSRPGMGLAAAQASKHEHICRKLGLHDAPGARLLDVGCGWGSMAIHAAIHHDAEVVGITISQEQARSARERVEAEGLTDRVEIRLQDYRELRDETFDAISSIGMFEHVGAIRIGQYFDTLRALLRPKGRLLNHAISTVGTSRLDPDSFVYRYVFPDGELIDVAQVCQAMQRAGFEVRDVESLREHYATTLRAWMANLDRNWHDAVAEVGEARARAWKLYMAGSVVGFEDGGNNVHQVLGVVPDADGASGMPATRPA